MWLFLLAPTALAKDPPDCASVSQVTAHKLQIDIDTRSARQSETWTVKASDPSACAAGLRTPTSLVNDRAVVNGRLQIPFDTEPDREFQLRRAETDTSGPFSGGFAAPSVATDGAEIVLTAPSQVPLTVWTDRRAEVDVEKGRTRTVTVRWPAGDDVRQFVWSTHPDWPSAGVTLDRTVSSKLTDKRGLLHLGDKIDGREVDAITAEVFHAIAGTDGGTWHFARNASQVAEEGRGTAAERGLVLISALRAAGHDAKPAIFLPDGPLEPPSTVPMPDLLIRPAVVVDTETTRTWIDPATPWTTLPDLPASLQGALALVPGEVAARVSDSVVQAGEVRITTEGSVADDGTVTWAATLHAARGGAEALRARLNGRTAADRAERITRLLELGHPELEQVVVRASGLDDATRDVTLEISGTEELFEEFGTGLKGKVPALLGPALASWLPADLLVREEVALKTPTGRQVVAISRVERTARVGVVVARSGHHAEGGARLLTEAIAGRGSRAGGFFAEQAKIGPVIYLSGADLKKTAKGYGWLDDLDPVQARALEVVTWLVADDEKHATKAIKSGHNDDPVAFRDWLVTLMPPDEPRGWKSLYALQETDEERLATIYAMAAAGSRRDAWKIASALTRSERVDTQIAALVAIVKLQGHRADPTVDIEAFQAWVEPAKLFKLAQKRAERDISEYDALRVPLAQHFIGLGLASDAGPLLKDAEGLQAEMTRAEYQANTGRARDTVMASVQKTLTANPTDPELYDGAARVAAQLGEHVLALRYAVAAARLAWVDSDRWLTASNYALAVGDLPAAVDAARHASDIAPDDSAPGVTLQLLATLAGDTANATVGTERCGYEAIPGAILPASFPDVIIHAHDEHRYALLRHRDRDVIADKKLLEERAAQSEKLGLWDHVARDGALLRQLHNDKAGDALVFAGMRRAWSTRLSAPLDRSVSSKTVREARMEYRFLTGGDPVADARALGKDHDRAKRVSTARYDPSRAAELDSFWPVGTKNPEGVEAPDGFQRNTLLGGVEGVVAFSDSERAMSLLVTDQNSGRLPPPVSLLYRMGRTVEALEGGGFVKELTGGEAPAYAAYTLHKGNDTFGIAMTPGGARRALMLGIATE